MTTIDRCARAIAEVLQQLEIELHKRHGKNVWLVWHSDKREFQFEADTRAECQHWIDRQAAIASTEALLPVSAELAEFLYDTDERLWDAADGNVSVNTFTAAITHIVKELQS